MSSGRAILFTAFEPSGDALAARLISELRRRDGSRPIYALGGEAMQAAGAQLIEHSTEHAAMLRDAIAQVASHKRRLGRLATWMREHPLAAVVPTDSPAANWGVCKLARKLQPDAKVLHLAAPQLWAWASWRVRRMQRLSDLALCLLPFEPEWFAQRGVKATFVGHPLFEEIEAGVASVSPDLPTTAGMKLALLPGSRHKEIDRNWPTMLRAHHQLLARHGELRAVVALRNEQAQRWKDAATHKARLREDPTLMTVAGRTREVLRWADVVLTVSGTATLEVLAMRRPMVALYNAGRIEWHAVGQFLISTRTFTLPNLVSEHLGEGRVIEELVPHFGAVPPVVAAVDRLLTDASARAKQVATFDRIRAVFSQTRFSEAAGDAVQAALEN